MTQPHDHDHEVPARWQLASVRPSRRRFVQSMAAMALVPGGVVQAAAELEPPREHGRIKPPMPVPALDLVRHDGVSTTLFDLLNNHVTAVQLMFSRCTTTCPIQGSIFARVQKLIRNQAARKIQLISITVDPDNDTPAVMKAWLQRFKARPGWIAATPRAGDVERLRDFAGRRDNPSDNHSLQVQMFSRRGELVWRTGDLPAAEEIAAILNGI